ncbi:MAG: mechanosensitive ion channel family protein [Burkholderiaceae bacterium]|jgi:small conductance mechanosensitive channel
MKELTERFFVAQFGSELPIWAKTAVAMANILLILAIAWMLMSFSSRLLRALNRRVVSQQPDQEERKRLDTLIRVVRYIASVVIGAITIMLVLSEMGISIAPILATAGVAGLAVGFGAQSLVKDYFTGFVMLLENQIRLGDAVEVGGKTGIVEEVTLRYVRLRDLEGAVHYVPNGVIATVTNRSREFAFALVDIAVSYGERLDRAESVIRRVGTEMRGSEAFASRILDDLEIMGVEQWADAAVMVRCRFKVAGSEQGPIRREFLRRLKNAFDQEGIEIPFPSRAVSTKNSS